MLVAVNVGVELVDELEHARVQLVPQRWQVTHGELLVVPRVLAQVLGDELLALGVELIVRRRLGQLGPVAHAHHLFAQVQPVLGILAIRAPHVEVLAVVHVQRVALTHRGLNAPRCCRAVIAR